MRLLAAPYEVPFRRPIPTAHGTMTMRLGWGLLLDAGEGRIGCSEVAPLPGWGTEGFDEAAAALDVLTSRPLSVLPPDAAGLDSWLDAAGLARERLPATRAGVELACLDLMARARGQSLAAFLSEGLFGRPPLAGRVAINALLTSRSPEALAEEALARTAEGYGTLKLKVGLGAIAEDVSRLRAVREAVGPGIRLRADANGAWDLSTAVEAMEALRPFDLEYLEQPVPEAEGLAALQARALMPVAADESAQEAEEIRALIARHAVDWLILKPMALGGLLYAAKLAQAAQRAGIGVALTSVLDRGVGMAATLHLAAALGLEAACGLSNTHLEPEHFVGPLPEAGGLALAALGHGVSRERSVFPREAAR